MDDTGVSFINISSKFIQALVPSVNKVYSECLMQRTMLVAVNASAERLIAPWYLMIICPLAFSSSAQKDDNYLLGAKSVAQPTGGPRDM